MASRKPDFRLSMPATRQPDVHAHHSQRTLSSPRSPRFNEDFDAPFSEALLNASRTTLASNVSDGEPRTLSRNSLDAHHKRPYWIVHRPKYCLVPSSLPKHRQGSRHNSASLRRSSVNDQIREWASKSLVFTRKGSGQPDPVEISQSSRIGSKASNADSVPPADNIGSVSNPICR